MQYIQKFSNNKSAVGLDDALIVSNPFSGDFTLVKEIGFNRQQFGDKIFTFLYFNGKQGNLIDITNESEDDKDG